tara:strand:- start:1457 stop:1954 length:498 start_codon:yes stop_codon:yes gene_type:complete
MMNLLPERIILEEISKLKPLKYNQFYWWRRYSRWENSLDNKAPFLDKILNGDYDFNYYYWDYQLSMLEIEEKRQKAEDYEHFIDLAKLDFERKKRLKDDFLKLENECLINIKLEFLKHFNITEEQYDQEIEKCEGTLADLYYNIQANYVKKTIVKSKRGRPKKQK